MIGAFIRTFSIVVLAGLLSFLPEAAFDLTDNAQAAQRNQGATPTRGSRSRSRHSIIVMVNDSPITKFSIRQRAALLSLQTNIGKTVRSRFKRMIKSDRTRQVFQKMQRDVINSNRGKSREQLIKIFRARQKRYALGLQKQAIKSARRGAAGGLRRKALNELIEEQLKLQAAKKVNVVIAKGTVDRVIAGMAKRNKKTPKQFAANLKRLGVNISTMRARMKANFAWRQTIRRKFGALVAINDAQIDDTIAAAANLKTESSVKLLLHKILLPLSSSSDQLTTAKRFSQAERISKRFRNCKTIKRLVKGIANAKYTKLGLRNPTSFSEPTRTMLLTAGDNQITPPTLGANGIELYAVCGRRAGRGSEKQRQQVKGNLRQQEFLVMASRHMRDVRTEARICRRQAVPYAMTLPPCS